MKLLVIAPHPDDEVLGVGGTIAKHAKEGDEIHLCVVTKAYTPDWSEEFIENKKKEVLKVNKILGIKKFTKKEKAELEIEAQKVKGKRYKTYHKYLCSIKHRVIEYVNERMKTEYVFEQNDVVDAIGLCLAYYDEVNNEVG